MILICKLIHGECLIATPLVNGIEVHCVETYMPNIFQGKVERVKSPAHIGPAVRNVA